MLSPNHSVIGLEQRQFAVAHVRLVNSSQQPTHMEMVLNIIPKPNEQIVKSKYFLNETRQNVLEWC